MEIVENGSLKPIPTGPRAHKKPRLSDSQPSPARSNVSLPPPASNPAPLSASGRSTRRERSPRDSRKSPVKDLRMDVDEDVKRTRTGSRDRSRDRVRERERERDRDRDRARDRERKSDRDRPREREREHDRNGERHKEKERDRTRRNGTHGGRSNNNGGASNGGSRKTVRGYAAQDNGGDRTLAERIGL